MSDEKTSYEGRFDRKFAGDGILFVRALLLLVVARLSLAATDYVRTAKLFGEQDSFDSDRGQAQGLATFRYRAAWAVSKASRIVRYDRPCLAQALVLRFILRRKGISSDLRIGVKKNDDLSIRAHAWVEKDGIVLIGGASSPFRYTMLTPEDQITL
ncbi:MAG: lasso peptide biosynthesis B2 protein [Rhodothermales bacterium]|nr:lasso peptide biosynthesis B2 protein [Rhodothermales bacterium]